MRKSIAVGAIIAGIIFVLAGASEADYETAIGQVSGPWVKYLEAGAVLMLIGFVAGYRA